MIAGYTVLDQYDEARRYIAKAKQLGLNGTDMLAYDLSLDGAIHDTAEIQKILAEGAGRPDQSFLTGQLGSVQAGWGQFRAAAATLQRAAGQAGQAKRRTRKQPLC